MLKCIECESEDIVGFIVYEKYTTRDGEEVCPTSIVAVCKEHYNQYMKE